MHVEKSIAIVVTFLCGLVCGAAFLPRLGIVDGESAPLNGSELLASFGINVPESASSQVKGSARSRPLRMTGPRLNLQP